MRPYVWDLETLPVRTNIVRGYWNHLHSLKSLFPHKYQPIRSQVRTASNGPVHAMIGYVDEARFNAMTRRASEFVSHRPSYPYLLMRVLNCTSLTTDSFRRRLAPGLGNIPARPNIARGCSDRIALSPPLSSTHIELQGLREVHFVDQACICLCITDLSL